jgi:hypothetical protein
VFFNWLIITSGAIILTLLIATFIKVRKNMGYNKIINDYKKGISANPIVDFKDIYFAGKNVKTKTNVSRLTLKKLKLESSKCAYCKRKVRRLSFYLSRSGQVIGVCDLCKVQAERQSLPRL